MNNHDNLFGNVICGYSREQAIEDGVLVDVSYMAFKMRFKVPVAVTHTVWEQYIEWSEADSDKQTTQHQSARLQDVLWMGLLASRFARDSGEVKYKLSVVPRNGRSRVAKTIILKMVISAGDEGEPVITIMLPSED